MERESKTTLIQDTEICQGTFWTDPEIVESVILSEGRKRFLGMMKSKQPYSSLSEGKREKDAF